TWKKVVKKIRYFKTVSPGKSVWRNADHDQQGRRAVPTDEDGRAASRSRPGISSRRPFYLMPVVDVLYLQECLSSNVSRATEDYKPIPYAYFVPPEHFAITGRINQVFTSLATRSKHQGGS